MSTDLWTWKDWALLVGIGLAFWGYGWFQLAVWEEEYEERKREYIRGQIGTNYGERSIEKKEAEGFEVCSDPDPRYGSVWMKR